MYPCKHTVILENCQKGAGSLCVHKTCEGTKMADRKSQFGFFFSFVVLIYVLVKAYAL